MDVSPISYNAHLLLGWSQGGKYVMKFIDGNYLVLYFWHSGKVLEIIFRDVSTELVSGEMMELNIEIPWDTARSRRPSWIAKTLFEIGDG